MRILGVLAFGAVALGLFWPGLALAPESLVAEALIIVFKITVVVCGAMVATALLMARCGSAVSRVAAALGVNEYAVLGPVSYTHLDVYKRQTPASPTRS